MPKVHKATRGFGSPGRYIQGPGEIENLEKYTRIFGKKVLALIDSFFFPALTAKLNGIYSKTDSTISTMEFSGEITEEKIEEITIKANTIKPDVVVGIGGGKTLDTAKAVADNIKAALIIMPTTASTDAPCSALSVIYKPNGEHSHARFYNKNPELVLVDSQIIANAPIRYLIAGMGDALSTYFEAMANDASDTVNYINLNTNGGFKRTRSAMALAKLCYETLLEDGLNAKIAAQQGVVTDALENIIEANTLLSGLGFENTGCAGAHSVGDGITALPAGSKSLHGEKCAFGTICQLVAENKPMELINEVINFCLSVGLPVTLEDLLVDATEANIRTIAEVSMKSHWRAEPFTVTAEKVYQDIITANTLGNNYKKLCR